jgi:glucose/arabinose dehydrogenase
VAGLAALAAIALVATAACDHSDRGRNTDPSRNTRNTSPTRDVGGGYVSTGRSCGSWPRVAVGTAEGTCLGLVAASADRRFKPRVLLELPGRPNEFLITDLDQQWAPGRGRLWYLDARAPDAVRLQPILDGLTIPHPLVVGPDGWIYMGEDARITAFPPSTVGADGRLDASALEVVLDGLPPLEVDGQRISAHPIHNFVFDGRGNLFVSIGAYSDHCAKFVGRECHEADARADGGVSADPHDWGGVLRRYDRVGDRAYGPGYQVVATGLRNSLGLLFTPSGDLLQAENGRDFQEADRPFDEINRIPRAELYGEAQPKHYGWPYCYDAYATGDGWVGYDGFRCAPDDPEYRPPYLLLPPHGAPLGLAYYTGHRLGGLRGTLIVPLHGYRPSGQRILAFDVDEHGLPLRAESASYRVDPTRGTRSRERPYPPHGEGRFAGVARYLVSAWFEVDGLRPQGAPVAPLVASDGSIWIADDANRAILRIDRAERP